VALTISSKISPIVSMNLLLLSL